MDIDIINMRFEYSDMNKISDVKYPDSDVKYPESDTDRSEHL